MSDQSSGFPHMSGDAKKQLLLESALWEFSEKGFQGASTRAIALRAGVAHGLMYYHFKDKKTLFLQLCRSLREWVVAYVRQETEEEAPFETMLRMGFTQYLLILFKSVI